MDSTNVTIITGARRSRLEGMCFFAGVVEVGVSGIDL